MTATSMQNSKTNLADRLALSADSAIHSTQYATNKAFDKLSGGVESLRGRAGPLMEKVSTKADAGKHYIEAQPMKSLLIAAATGAALAALLSWMGRSRGSRY
jgi:ElaB/YqjD/DUF883 family membrane-anchored ribosome-binding protein